MVVCQLGAPLRSLGLLLAERNCMGVAIRLLCGAQGGGGKNMPHTHLGAKGEGGDGTHLLV